MYIRLIKYAGDVITTIIPFYVVYYAKKIKQNSYSYTY